MSAAGDLVDAIAAPHEARIAARYAAEHAAADARLARHYADLARQETQQRRCAVIAGAVGAVILAGAAWWALASVLP